MIVRLERQQFLRRPRVIYLDTEGVAPATFRGVTLLQLDAGDPPQGPSCCYLHQVPTLAAGCAGAGKQAVGQLFKGPFLLSQARLITSDPSFLSM